MNLRNCVIWDVKSPGTEDVKKKLNLERMAQAKMGFNLYASPKSA